MSQSFSDGIGRDSIFSKALGGVIPSRPPSLHSNGISHSASLGPQVNYILYLFLLKFAQDS